jgi:tRNA modification GTPase
MDACAADMTGPGAGAIATIQLFGESAQAVLSGVFRSSENGPPVFQEGRILLGHIVDGADIIDQVTVGCEGPQTFAIHCHGNPLIVERIMKMLQSRGVELVTAEALLARTLSAELSGNSIAIEAKLALTKVKTVEGARIVAAQMEGGLCQRVRQWSLEMGSISPREIGDQAKQILSDSETAHLIVCGCTIALVGPPNTGKSTLLNALAGCEKVIVTDIEGTTRDWVSTEILIPPLAATIIDTAGLDAELTATNDNAIDQAAQARSVEVIDKADLILLVLDLSRPTPPSAERLLEALADKRVLTVLNKSDLPPRLDLARLPAGLCGTIRISARQGSGIDDLIRAIHHTCGVTDFDPHTPIAFTARQRDLLGGIASALSETEVASLISELLEGPVSV